MPATRGSCRRCARCSRAASATCCAGGARARRDRRRARARAAQGRVRAHGGARRAPGAGRRARHGRRSARPRLRARSAGGRRRAARCRTRSRRSRRSAAATRCRPCSSCSAHADAAHVLAAVRTLGRIGDSRALSALSEVERNAPSAALRAEVEDAFEAIAARMELLGEEAPALTAATRAFDTAKRAAIVRRKDPAIVRLRARWSLLLGHMWLALGAGQSRGGAARSGGGAAARTGRRRCVALAHALRAQARTRRRWPASAARSASIARAVEEQRRRRAHARAHVPAPRREPCSATAATTSRAGCWKRRSRSICAWRRAICASRSSSDCIALRTKAG